MKPCPSLYNGAILQKLGNFFAFNWDVARKKDVFAQWKVSLKLGWSRGVWGKQAVASSVPSTLQRSLPSVSGRKTSLRKKVGAFSPLAGMQQVRQMTWLHSKLCWSWVESVAFVNGLWLAHHRWSRKGHHRSPYKGHCCLTCKNTILKLTTVQFIHGLIRPLNKWPVWLSTGLI